MALSPEQIEEIKILYSLDKYSNREIAKKVGVGNKVVGTIVEKYGFKKDTIDTLIKAEVQNIIIQDEIKTQKDTLNPTQKQHYKKKFADATKHLDLFNDSAVQNQMITNQAQEQLIEFINTDIKESNKNGKQSYAAIEHLPNLMAIAKITEANRKQLYGVTQPLEEKPDEKGSYLKVMIPKKKEDN